MPSEYGTSKPLELVHLEILAQCNLRFRKHMQGRFFDDYTVKSDVELLKLKSELYSALVEYKNRAEEQMRSRSLVLTALRLDRTGEDTSNAVINFCRQLGIKLEHSPAYVSESNGAAEGLIHEHLTVHVCSSMQPHFQTFCWAKQFAMETGCVIDYLQGESVASSQFSLGNPSKRIDFKSILEFGAQGYAFIYRSKTVAGKKLLPRAAFGCFLRVETSSRLLRVFAPELRGIIFCRRDDFKVYNKTSC